VKLFGESGMKADRETLPLNRSARKYPMRRTQWLKRLAHIKVQLSSLARKLSQLEIAADAAERECRELLEEIASSTAAWLDAGSKEVAPQDNREGRKSGKMVADSLKRMASEGVWYFKLDTLFDGYAEIHINDAKPLRLTPALAELLSILAAGMGKSKDGQVGWKSTKKVADILSKRTGTEVSTHLISQRVSRLRDTLEQNNINPYFVQTNPSRSEIRFALKRDAAVRNSA
jgi:hypothetical protein